MAKPVILAADDSITVRKLIEISLKPGEFDLHFAVDGKECLTKAGQLKPSLLLLDYILPDMKGIDICQALLSRRETRHIPVLLISGNGAAIRQTYENASNVADYLTKPFAPNVLAAVVGHLLAKTQARKEEDNDAQALAVPAPAAVPAAQDLLAKNLHDRVTQSLLSGLRDPLMAFPGLEAGRENEPAVDYFLDFLASSGAIEYVSRSLQAILALPEFKPAPVHLRCTSELVPTDRILIHLNETRATGLLRVELADEVIQLQIEAGEIVFITSNNPKRYCAGAAIPFRSLPQSAIAAAVAEQQKRFVPFFVTLQALKVLPAGARLAGLLQVHGTTALTRVVRAPSASFTLEESQGLPPELQPFRQRHPLPGLLLAAYRSVDDWLTIEAAISGFDATLQRNSDSGYRASDLKLDALESELLSMIDGIRTVQELITRTGQHPFDFCRRLFPLVRLGLVIPVKTPVMRSRGHAGYDPDDAVFGNGRPNARAERPAHTFITANP